MKKPNNFGITINIINGYEHLTDIEVRELWDRGVNCDDWDYMVLCHGDVLDERDVEEHDWETNKPKIVKYYTPKFEYRSLERLLTGCSHNIWYKVYFRGEKMAIGISYHS